MFLFWDVSKWPFSLWLAAEVLFVTFPVYLQMVVAVVAGVIDGRRHYGRCLGIGLLVGGASLGVIIGVEAVLYNLPICWGMTITSGVPWCSGVLRHTGELGFSNWVEVWIRLNLASVFVCLVSSGATVLKVVRDEGR